MSNCVLKFELDCNLIGEHLFVAVSATAFYRAQPCVQFLCDVLELRHDDLRVIRGLTDSQRVKFTKEIRGLKVSKLRDNNVASLFHRSYRIMAFTHFVAPRDIFFEFVLFVVDGNDLDFC